MSASVKTRQPFRSRRSTSTTFFSRIQRRSVDLETPILLAACSVEYV